MTPNHALPLNPAADEEDGGGAELFRELLGAAQALDKDETELYPPANEP